MESKASLGVTIVGCGTVGGGAATLLTRDREILAARIAPALELRHVVDVNFANARRLGLDEKLLSTDLDRAISDPAVGVVVELVGGTTFARRVIEQALRAGKHVVTANKALLAHHGAELYALARANGVCIAFEASCAGGVPILRALCDGLIANRIDALYGIVNGTCNYILTQMTDRGQSYADALADAQRDGLAEADPTLDVAGTDSAHKLAILAALAFGRRVDFEKIPVAGIDSLELCDLRYGRELGYVVKLLAIAQRRGRGVSLRVCPSFISLEHPLAWVSGPFNAVSVYGHATGHTMYYGRGAGSLPTASAVVADIASVAMGVAPRLFENLRLWPDLAAPAEQLPPVETRSRYYLRVMAEDRPGVFARIAEVLGRHEISISSVLQHEAPENAQAFGVPVVITTHSACDGAVQQALVEVDALDVIKAPSVRIGIVDEHPEQF
ncbi:MAG TPA: homoserine dehydrogenase [Phycisphaerales bacterium]|nr:homoserine dehydrogenase [Phycisphaerales bacterium]